MDEFPSNSDKSKLPPKKVERVTTSEPIRRQKPLGRRLRDTFIAGDPKSAISVAVLAVLVPAAKDAIAEASSQAVERLIFGEKGGSGRRRPSGPPQGHNGYVSYNRMSSQPTPRDRVPSRMTRDAFEFEDINLAHQAGADAFILKPFDIAVLKNKLKNVINRKPRKREAPIAAQSTLSQEFPMLGKY